jgi:hypothetical protein
VIGRALFADRVGSASDLPDPYADFGRFCGEDAGLVGQCVRVDALRMSVVATTCAVGFGSAQPNGFGYLESPKSTHLITFEMRHFVESGQNHYRLSLVQGIQG